VISLKKKKERKKPTGYFHLRYFFFLADRADEEIYLNTMAKLFPKTQTPGCSTLCKIAQPGTGLAWQRKQQCCTSEK